MKISAVITANKIKIGNHIKKPTEVLLAFIPVALGIVFGCVVFSLSDKDTFGSLGEYFISFATQFSHKNKPEIISGLILTDIPYIALMLIFGVSAVGRVPVFMLSFFKSAGIGAVAAYLYSTYSLKGIEYCLLVFFPGKAVLLFAMLLLTASCYAMSSDINRLIKGNSDITVELSKYTLRSLLIYIVFILASLIEFTTIVCFSSLFSFS